VALTVLLPVSSAYLFTPMGCRGLVEGLYRFTLYALPLTTVSVAFGSDWHLSLPVSFRDVHPAIAHRGGNPLPIRSGKSLMSMTFAT
jgi:hypothetical protein